MSTRSRAPGSAAARAAVAASPVTSASTAGDSRAASASVKKTGCSPARGRTVPAIVYVRDPAAVSTATRLPMTAGPATTISLAERGGRPAVST